MTHVIQCDVCNDVIKKPEDGRVIGDYFGRFVESVVGRAEGDLDKALEGPEANFVNAITRCYFIQFEGHFHADGSGMKAFAKFERTRMDEKARLAAVVKDYPKTKDLWLIVHTACIPDELGEGGYPIGLSRIDTPAKALDWTFHLREKQQWNAHGWVSVLQDLFGRSPVPGA